MTNCDVICRYKEQVHGEELKEDEQDAAEIERMFPSYEQVPNASVIQEITLMCGCSNGLWFLRNLDLVRFCVCSRISTISRLVSLWTTNLAPSLHRRRRCLLAGQPRMTLRMNW